MRNTIHWFAAVLFFIAALHAGEPTDIDREIAKIRSAPPQERVKLMNDFKRRLFQMNQDQRRMAIERLRHSMPNKNGHVPNRGMMRQPMMNQQSPATPGFHPPQHAGGGAGPAAGHPAPNRAGPAAPSFNGMPHGGRDGPKHGKGPMGNGRH
jgi:hypothetical protein